MKEKIEYTGFKLTKTCTFSDKKTFEFISKTLELSNDVENEFKISEKEGIFVLKQITEDSNIDLNNHNEESEVAEVTLDKSATTNTVEVTEEVSDTIGNVNYPEVDDKELSITPSEDVNNQW